jgi:hypothetical protein
MKFKNIIALLTASALMFTGSYGSSVSVLAAENTEEAQTSIVTALSKIDNTKWNFNEEDCVYWQIGISYCENPV